MIPPRHRPRLANLLWISLVIGLSTGFVGALRGAGAAASDEEADASVSAELPIDREASWFVAVTERAGILGFLGHRHAVLATEWTAELRYDGQDPSAASVRVALPTAAVRIDTERARDLAGLDRGPDAETVEDLQAKVLGPENLAADRHPELRFVSTGVERTGLRELTVAGELTIRGETRAVTVPVEVEALRDGRVRFTGTFTIEQTAFGIEPESVAGVVNVADPVEVRFRLVVSAP